MMVMDVVLTERAMLTPLMVVDLVIPKSMANILDHRNVTPWPIVFDDSKGNNNKLEYLEQ